MCAERPARPRPPVRLVFRRHVKRFIAPLLVALAFAAVAGLAADERRAAPVGVGEIAPDFMLEDQDGGKHALSAERGKRPVVLAFYRGYW